MRLKLWKWEVEVRRESTSERLERVIRERQGGPVVLPEAGWWQCLECGEYGEFDASDDFRLVYWPSGYYDWRTHPEMRCACRRAENGG